MKRGRKPLRRGERKSEVVSFKTRARDLAAIKRQAKRDGYAKHTVWIYDRVMGGVWPAKDSIHKI